MRGLVPWHGVLFRHFTAVLDEATSAVGEEMEEVLYTLASQYHVTVISVGHRASLHKVRLNLATSAAVRCPNLSGIDVVAALRSITPTTCTYRVKTGHGR